MLNLAGGCKLKPGSEPGLLITGGNPEPTDPMRPGGVQSKWAEL